MGRVECDVAEHRLGSRTFHVITEKSDCLCGDVIRDVTLTLLKDRVVLHWWIEIITPMPFCKTVEGVEPTSQWMVWPLCAIVPFPKTPCNVPSLFENISNCLLFRGHSLFPSSYATDPTSIMIPSCEKLSPCWSTDRLHKKLLE